MRISVFVMCAAAYVAGDVCLDAAKAQDLSKPTKKGVMAMLGSRNTEPNLPDARSLPSFDASFDWSEQDRVWKNVNELFGSVEGELEEIVKNIDNKAYSITIQTFSGSNYNWDVGKVCRTIIGRTLSEPFYAVMTPETRESYGEFRMPAFCRDPKLLDEWLSKRRGKTLRQLQVDSCEWAVERLSERDTDDRDRWISAIRKVADSLRAGSAPIRSEGLKGEEFRRYRMPERSK